MTAREMVEAHSQRSNQLEDGEGAWRGEEDDIFYNFYCLGVLGEEGRIRLANSSWGGTGKQSRVERWDRGCSGGDCRKVSTEYHCGYNPNLSIQNAT